MRARRQKSTQYLTASAVSVALGVLLLALGSLLQVLDITMAAVASLLVVFAVIEMGGKYPYMVYAATALLSLLLPIKTPALFYALFAGYYPILKAAVEKHLSNALGWVVKLAVFGVCLAAALFVGIKFFMPDLVIDTYFWWAVALATPVFVVYDIALSRLITLYVLRWRGRFQFFK